tara:strand:+ start:2296 stop:2526 length:231 start_codon:yes stop_codon:yes gene_type:complete
LDTEKLIRLGQELQAELQFGPEDGVTSKAQYDEILKLIDILTYDHETHDKNWALLEVLVPAITRYDDNNANWPESP